MPEEKHEEGCESSSSVLSKFSQDELIRILENAILSERAAASYVCGGSIPIQKVPENPQPGPSLRATPVDLETPLDNEQPIRKNQKAPPVNIFWSKEDDAPARKLTLPIDSFPIEDSSDERLTQLVSDCEPASFVLNPEYRRAGKLDINRFATSFCPADYNIIEHVERILLPRFNNNADRDGLSFRKLTAELYKLNVYSGPNGHFRKHVDTPRSEGQIGSLVVCLPSKFEGGELIVGHEELGIVFEWDADSADRIQWAAFYSDCEHEVTTVTAGHRITLTYNLFLTEPIGTSLMASPVMDVQRLPLFAFLGEILSGPRFMEEGGQLGIWCSHSYPHNTEQAARILPRALKGSDLVMYASLRALGIELKIRPAFVLEEMEETSVPHYYRGIYYGGHSRVWMELAKRNRQEKWKGKGTNEIIPFDEYDGSIVIHTGDKLKAYTVEDWTDDECENKHEPIEECFGGGINGEVVWIGNPRHRKKAFGIMTLRNEARVRNVYSYAVIIATIPPVGSPVRAALAGLQE